MAAKATGRGESGLLLWHTALDLHPSRLCLCSLLVLPRSLFCRVICARSGSFAARLGFAIVMKVVYHLWIRVIVCGFDVTVCVSIWLELFVVMGLYKAT